MGVREPQVGDRVRAIFEGTVEEYGGTLVARSGTSLSYLEAATSVEVIGPVPQPGEIWECSLTQESTGKSWRERLFYTSGISTSWLAGDGRVYRNSAVTPIRKLYPT